MLFLVQRYVVLVQSFLASTEQQHLPVLFLIVYCHPFVEMK
ncbi:putative secreted protein [Listeria monocytogenes]|nr:putative secreted protein [Listeria monocytogenes]